MPTNLLRRTLIAIALVGATAASGFGQQATSLSGSIRDPQQAAIAYARINVYPVGAASPLSAQADAERAVSGQPSFGRLLRHRGRGGRLQERVEGDRGGGGAGGA